MATTDPVQIVIEIIDQFSDDLAELRSQLEALDATDINIDFDINDVAREVAKTRAQIESIPNNEIVTFHARTRGMARVRAQIASAQSAIGSGGGIPGLHGMSVEGPFGGGGFGGGAGFDVSDATDVDFRPVGGGRGLFARISDQIGDMNDNLRASRRSWSLTSRSLSRFVPNIMMVWNALAAMIPVLVTLAAAAIGLAGALGAVATAGVAIVGAGLLGWGDTFGENVDNLTEKLEQLGSRLFDVMQPAATTFQPILEDWLEGAPRQLQQLVGPMQELAVFADALSAAGAGFIDWVEQVVTAMVGMEEQVEQVMLRLGEVAGGFIIDFMSNMVDFAYRNQEALIQLSSSLRTLLAALLNISVVVASTLAAFSPLVEIVGFFAELLNTGLGRALITAIGLFLTFAAVNRILLGAVALLNTGILATVQGIAVKYIPAVLSAIGVTDQWIARLTALRAAMLATGLGVALVAGGFALNAMMGTNASGPSTSAQSRGRGNGGNTYIQVEGDVGRREADRIIDQTHGTTREEMSIQEDIGE